MWAGTRNNCDMMQFLIENGADVNAVDNEGLNVLDVCVVRNTFLATKFIYHGGHGLEFKSSEFYLAHMKNKKFDIDLYIQYATEGRENVVHDMFLEKARLEYQAWLKKDLVVDTRETWREFFIRTRDFGDAKLVPREELTEEQQPHRSIYGKVACLINGIDPYPPKNSSRPVDLEKSIDIEKEIEMASEQNQMSANKS